MSEDFLSVGMAFKSGGEFDKGHKSHQDREAQVDDLYRQIGKLQVERDFLAKKLSL